MANDYYTNAADVVAGNKAKAEDINSRMELIEAGFDKLPSCISDAPTSKGFDETYTILDSTDEYHPPTSKQVRDGSLTYAEDTGTANTIIADLPQTPSAYVTGMTVTINLNATNTGSTTLNLNSLGAKSVKRINGDELSGGDVIAGRIAEMRYNGTYFQLVDGMYAIHSHNDLYYTEDEIDSLLSAQTHDDRYYTESEIDTLLDDKADTSTSVSNYTTNTTLSASQLTADTLFSNTGATSEVIFSLPSGAAGLVGRFLVTENQYVRVKAAAGEVVSFCGESTATGGYIRSDEVGTYFQLEWVDGKWVVVLINGYLRYDV